MILSNSENGAWVFRPLMEAVFANTVTPWEWEGYTESYLSRGKAA